MSHSTRPNAPTPLVEMRQLQKSYDGKIKVIDDLDLTIYRGEFLTLLGPSGSGKTTLLMMLAGFETPSGGEIVYDGRAISGLPPHDRNFGVVFQNYALFPHMSVFDNVAFPLTIRKMQKVEVHKRVELALSMVRLNDFADRRPAELSGGQQQRVALARALVFEPDLVLMDEPLGALDKNLREQLQIEIKQLHEKLQVTVVYVTHDQTEAMVLSDRIAIFNRGRIEQLDSPRRIHEQPATAFVANFMGETNMLTGKIAAVHPEGRCEIALANDRRFCGLSAGGDGVGSPKMMAIRPERIHLAPAPGACENVVAGTVSESIYLGDRMSLRIVTEDGLEFTVSGGVEQVDNPLTRGAPVEIGWKSEHCLLLEAD